MSSPRRSSFDATLRAAVDGDGWAFERLYHSLAQPITAFATVRGTADPEAITNDTFLKVFRNLGDFEGDESAFRSWVFAIARNLIIDAHRHAVRRPQISGDDVPDRAAPSAETEAMTAMSVDGVAAMLALLSEDQRDVIALRLVSDLSISEVSEILGKPITAVKALQRRGMRRLQREIIDEVVS